MTARTVEVFRMEHVDRCSATRPNHGPYMRNSCRGREIPFGLNGRPPLNIMPDEMCGVTEDQAPFWWGDWPTMNAEQALEAGWQFVKYVVPVDAARVSQGQIVFAKDQAERIGPIGIPSHMYAARETRDRAWRWHDERRDEERRLDDRVSLRKSARYARRQRCRRLDEEDARREREQRRISVEESLTAAVQQPLRLSLASSW